MVSKRYQNAVPMPENPCKIRLFGLLDIIPTRSLKLNLKRICLGILAVGILIICIIGKAEAIRFFVAILLPQLSLYNFKSILIRKCTANIYRLVQIEVSYRGDIVL